MELTLTLVNEKKGILDQFTYSKILGLFLLFTALPTFFILPFVPNASWFYPYFFSIVGLFIICRIIALFKYSSTYDYDTLGSVQFTDENLFIKNADSTTKIPLAQNNIKFFYNGIRRRGFHYGRDFPRSGIAEIVINEHQNYFVLITKYSDIESLKKLFNGWYHKKYHLEEFTRTDENYRLIELEQNFDWKRLTEIKENMTAFN